MAKVRTDPTPGTTYQAFGLRLRSLIDLPELAPAPSDGRASDATIAWGPVEGALSGAQEAEPFIHARPGACLIHAPPARILVRDGSSVVIEAIGGAPPETIRPFLLGSAFAVLCHQRGLTPLHASAIVWGGDAVAFAGPSGAGKSTLAAQVAATGAPVIADDLCVVSHEADGTCLAHAGVTRLKLGVDVLSWIGREAADLEAIGETRPKYALPLDAPAEAGPWKLRRIYVLGAAEPGGTSRPLKGASAVSAILSAIQRLPTARAMGLTAAIFHQASDIARACEITQVSLATDRGDPRRRWRLIRSSLG